MLSSSFQQSLNYNLLMGDSRQVLKMEVENTYDACICDPPYGIKIAKWDNEIPSMSHWQAILHVLKPGAICLSFGAPKLHHHLASHIEQAGFNVQDMIIWIETKKMININRLKSVYETICVAQKPYEQSIEYNMAKWHVGNTNIEEARIPWGRKLPRIWSSNPNGRHPSNIVGYLGDEYEKYFFAPRVTEKERGYYNDHPTVKPIALMAWLIKIFAPKGEWFLIHSWAPDQRDWPRSKRRVNLSVLKATNIMLMLRKNGLMKCCPMQWPRLPLRRIDGQ